MKKLYAIILSFVFISNAHSANKFLEYDSASRISPIEHSAVLYDEKGKVNFKVIDELVSIVLANNYKCDTVSGYRPMIMSRGFVLSCNKYAYSYDIKDVGGNIQVSVN